MFIKSTFMFVIASTITAAALTGCGAQYVNVPPIPGDVAFHNPNGSDVRTMEIAALKYVLQRTPPKGSFAIALPAGSTTDTQAYVMGRLPGGDAAAVVAGDALPTYRVAQIQARNWNCQVDVIAPEPNGDLRLTSVFLAKDIDGWFPMRGRKWSVPVDQALELARPLADHPDAPLPTEPAPAPAPAPTPTPAPIKEVPKADAPPAPAVPQPTVPAKPGDDDTGK